MGLFIPRTVRWRRCGCSRHRLMMKGAAIWTGNSARQSNDCPGGFSESCQQCVAVCREMSRRCRGDVADVSRDVAEMSRTCRRRVAGCRGVAEMSRDVAGCREMSRDGSRCRGGVAGCRGDVAEMSRTCRGRVARCRGRLARCQRHVIVRQRVDIYQKTHQAPRK